MSFYGSVYYQLIDAFSNIIVSNSNSNTSIRYDDTSGGSVSAEGRVDSLEFIGANRWIKIRTAEQDGRKIIQFFHAKPNPNDSGNGVSNADFSYYPNKDALTEATKDTDVYQFKAGDYFSAYDIKCDVTGHVIGFTKKSYQMPPEPQIEQDIDDLSRRTYLLESDVDNLESRDDTLRHDIEQNSQEIEQLKSIYYHTGDSDSTEDIFFGEEHSNTDHFPTYFGNIKNIISSISALVNGIDNRYIYDYLVNSGEFKDYETDRGFEIDNVSIGMKFITWCFKALKSYMDVTIGTLQEDVDSAQTLSNIAVSALGKNSSNDLIFNSSNTIAGTLGIMKNGNPCFNQINPIVDAIGTTDDENHICFFGKGNSIKDYVLGLESRILALEEQLQNFNNESQPSEEEPIE